MQYDKNGWPKNFPDMPKDWLTYSRVAALRRQGKTYREIAAETGYSEPHVKYMARSFRRLMDGLREHRAFSLSRRARTALSLAGIRPDDVALLTEAEIAALANKPGCGAKTLREIERYVNG